MLKKSKILTAAIILSSSFPIMSMMHTQAYAASQNSTVSNKIFAWNYFNAPFHMGHMSSKMASHTQVSFSQSNVQSNGTLSLNGSVLINGSKVPFNLTGQLYQGIHPGTIDGGLTDSTGNFTVMRFSLSPSSRNGLYFDARSRSIHGEVLALYLKKHGTRGITMIECPASLALGLGNMNEINTISTSLAKAPASVSLWFERFFKPDKVTKVVSPSTTTVNGSDPNTVDYSSYTDFYTFMSHSVQDTMTLQLSASYGSSTANEIVGRIEVYSTKFVESGYPTTYNTVTGWEVGGNGPVGVELYTPSPQEIQSETYGGLASSTPSFSPSASINVGWGPLSYSLTLNQPSNFVGTTATFGPDVSEASAYLPAGQYLQNVNNNFGVTFETTYATSTDPHVTVTDQMNYIFDMYNSLSAMDSGLQVQPVVPGFQIDV